MKYIITFLLCLSVATASQARPGSTECMRTSVFKKGFLCVEKIVLYCSDWNFEGSDAFCKLNDKTYGNIYYSNITDQQWVFSGETSPWPSGEDFRYQSPYGQAQAVLWTSSTTDGLLFEEKRCEYSCKPGYSR